VDSNDPQMCDFIEGEFLTEQVSDCCIVLLGEGKDRLGLVAQESSSYCPLWIARVNQYDCRLPFWFHALYPIESELQMIESCLMQQLRRVQNWSSNKELIISAACYFQKQCSLLLMDMELCLFLQVEAIKKVSEYVAQLRRVGKGHGTFV
jgi:hypothetical protein